jgi:hypothetical protein
MLRMRQIVKLMAKCFCLMPAGRWHSKVIVRLRTKPETARGGTIVRSTRVWMFSTVVLSIPRLCLLEVSVGLQNRKIGAIGTSSRINLFGVISERERASWAARSLVRWRRGQLRRILECPRLHYRLGAQWTASNLEIRRALVRRQGIERRTTC